MTTPKPAGKHSPAPWRTIVAICFLASLRAAFGAETRLPVEAVINEKWTGDFDAMLRRRMMRVLVVHSRTLYFVERGQPRGVVYDAFKEFEKEINRKRSKKQGEFHVVFIPVPRDEPATSSLGA